MPKLFIKSILQKKIYDNYIKNFDNRRGLDLSDKNFANFRRVGLSDNPRGFSLIELAVVILIIGILVAGILTANGLIKKTKISAAQSLTKSSPIAGITGNVLWLESSLEASFKDSESSSGDAVTAWYDQKSSVNKSLVVAAGTGPIYSNTINYIHAVKFLGSSANYLKVEDASFLNDTDYTIVVLEKRQSASAGYFIGDSSNSNSNPNQNLLLGYKNDGTIDHSQGAENSYASNISTYSSSGETPRVFTFVSDSINGKKTYINGILAAQSSDTTKLSNITTLAIGKGYTGEIGEIAIFTRALKTDERKATEDYLGKKYSVKVNRSTTASSSCINGIVTADGCKMDCSTSSIVGLSSPSSVLDGASNITGTCAETGYVGTLTLSCPAGTGQISASSSCGCDESAGYSPSGKLCVLSCPYSITGALPPTGTVNSASGTLRCDTTNHYSSTNYFFACLGGNQITGRCACATGYAYSGGNCNSCDTANNYVSDGNGNCVLGCAIPAGSGTSVASVMVGDSSVSCDITQYSGDLTYTCATNGILTVKTPCTIIPCAVETIPDASKNDSGSITHAPTTSENIENSVNVGDGKNYNGGAGLGNNGDDSEDSIFRPITDFDGTDYSNNFNLILGNGGKNFGNKISSTIEDEQNFLPINFSDYYNNSGDSINGTSQYEEILFTPEENSFMENFLQINLPNYYNDAGDGVNKVNRYEEPTSLEQE